MRSAHLAKLCKALLGENEYFKIVVRDDKGFEHKLFDPSSFFAITSSTPPMCVMTLLYDRHDRELIKIHPVTGFRNAAQRPRYAYLGNAKLVSASCTITLHLPSDREWTNEKERVTHFSPESLTVGSAVSSLLKLSGLSAVKDLLDLVEALDEFRDQLLLLHPLVVVMGCDRPFLQNKQRYSWHVQKNTRAVHLLDLGPKDAGPGRTVFLNYDQMRGMWRAYHVEDDYERLVLEAIRKYKDPPSKDVAAQQSIKRIVETEEDHNQLDLEREIDCSHVEDEEGEDEGAPSDFPHLHECRCDVCILAYMECSKNLSLSGLYILS